MSDTIYHFVYKTTNTKNNMFYIGTHSTYDLDDGYLGSGIYLKGAILKYGEHQFSREILSFHDSRQDAEKAEAQLVTKDLTLDENSYNIAKSGQHRFCEESQSGHKNNFYGKKHSEESRRKMREAAEKRRRS